MPPPGLGKPVDEEEEMRRDAKELADAEKKRIKEKEREELEFASYD